MGPRKKGSTQINKSRNQRRDIATETQIQKIIRDFSEQYYANKLDNLEEMDKFLQHKI